MNPKPTCIEDLLKNRLFRTWVLDPTPELNDYWEQFLTENPNLSDLVIRAKKYLLGIHKRVESDYPDEAVVARMYAKIDARIEESYLFLPSKRNRILWLAASLFIGVLGVTVWFSSLNRSPANYAKLVKTAEKELQEFVNNSKEEMTIYLPDNSCIRLSAGSKISYPRYFWEGAKREVYLEGSAFFDITECATMPFYVYSDELVTKVLGTSFHIQSHPEKAEVTIAVLTGKVSVSTRESISKGQMDELLLTPNQQALFERKTTSFKKSLVANPVMLVKAKTRGEFEFDDTPASKIFQSIESSYGVEIAYDEKLLGNCLLTASLTDENLFEMMDLICMALGARYFVEGAEIVVIGNGCPE